MINSDMLDLLLIINSTCRLCLGKDMHLIPRKTNGVSHWVSGLHVMHSLLSTAVLTLLPRFSVLQRLSSILFRTFAVIPSSHLWKSLYSPRRRSTDARVCWSASWGIAMSVDALSLACNIITLIDFGHKFYQSFRDTYENRKPDPNAEAKANDLLLLAERLKDSRKKAQRSAPKNDQLFQIAEKCAKAAADLHREIAKFDLPGASSRAPHGVQSLVSTAKRTWRQNRIEQLKKSLDDCQATMQTTVLFKMYESGEAEQVRRLENFDRLGSRLQNFVQAVSKQELRMSELLAENRSLHQETQAVVRHEVAALRNLQISEAELTRLKASLKFPGQSQRYNDLRPAHSKSFRWLLGSSSEGIDDSDAQILDTDHSGTSVSDSQGSEKVVGSETGINKEPEYLRQLREETYGDFARWLEFEPDSKLYWVSGKPGAGKSTLMKYLLEETENTNLIKDSHLVSHHFFWLGAANKRSNYNDMEGMFMTILRQLLEHDSLKISLAAILMQKLPRLCQKENSTDWSLRELKGATQEALRLLSDHYSIYLLLDALDEHMPAADHDELIRVVKCLESMPKVRLVISSRRERIFETNFSGARQLHLQRLTAPDIHYFALESLSNAISIENYASTDFLNRTVQTIVEKANGVFLWARLAVDSIKRGIVDGNPMDELKDRLEDMPTELSDYFRHIWMRLGDDKKRYQTRAANVFSLLCCRSWSYEMFVDDTIRRETRNPVNHIFANHLDLLCLSLALDPTYARLVVQGDETMETALLDLCKTSERMIISSCAGLIEIQVNSKVEYCIPCNREPMVLSKRYDFIHRTARDFFRDTEDGKHILAANNLGQHSPDFRVLLAVLARSVLFREPKKCKNRCLPRRWLDLGHVLNDLDESHQFESSLDQAQRYLLLEMCHRVYDCFSGHPENPMFQDWKLRHSCSIHPFIAVASFFGHGNYSANWMKTQVSKGRTFHAKMYTLISRIDMTVNVFCNDEYRMLFEIDQCFASFDTLNNFLPLACLHPNYGSNCFGNHARQLQNGLQSLIVTLSALLRGVLDFDNPAEMLTSTIKHLSKLVNSSGFDHFATFPLMYIASEPSGEPEPDRQGMIHYAPFEIDELGLADDKDALVHMLYETNPLWVIQSLARDFVRKPGVESLCHNLMQLVDLRDDDGRKIQKPQPFLLFKCNSRELSAGIHQSISVIGAKHVPVASRIQFYDLDQDDLLGGRLQELWEELGTDVLNEAQIEEFLVTHRVWSSKAELEQLMKSCDIRIAGEESPKPEDDERFIVPPEGCSAEQETLSHLTMRFNLLNWSTM